MHSIGNTIKLYVYVLKIKISNPFKQTQGQMMIMHSQLAEHILKKTPQNYKLNMDYSIIIHNQ